MVDRIGQLDIAVKGVDQEDAAVTHSVCGCDQADGEMPDVADEDVHSSGFHFHNLNAFNSMLPLELLSCQDKSEHVQIVRNGQMWWNAKFDGPIADDRAWRCSDE